MKKLNKIFNIVTLISILVLFILALTISNYSAALGWFFTGILFTAYVLTEMNKKLFVKYIDIIKTPDDMSLTIINENMDFMAPEALYETYGITKERFEHLCDLALHEIEHPDKNIHVLFQKLAKECKNKNELALLMYFTGFYTHAAAQQKMMTLEFFK